MHLPGEVIPAEPVNAVVVGATVRIRALRHDVTTTESDTWAGWALPGSAAPAQPVEAQEKPALPHSYHGSMARRHGGSRCWGPCLVPEGPHAQKVGR